MSIVRCTRILFLFSDYTGYFRACVASLKQLHDVELMGVRKFIHPDAPHTFDMTEFKDFVNKTELTKAELLNNCINFAPDIVYVAGWEDRDFLNICYRLKQKGAKVVTGIDNHWHGTLKQRLGVAYFHFHLKKHYTHAWVAGNPQYEFARKIGFEKHQIIDSLYSADLATFRAKLDRKGKPFHRELLFVGRLKKIKGVDILYQVFADLTDEERNGWRLRIIGNGELADEMPSIEGKITVEGFKSPEELAALAQNVGGFCLPSLIEPWGVVVHEFASAGLPLLLSNVVGAATTFLIPGYNGYMFEEGKSTTLKMTLLRFFRLDDEEIQTMGDHSKLLSQLITPEFWSHKLMSLVHSNP